MVYLSGGTQDGLWRGSIYLRVERAGTGEPDLAGGFLAGIGNQGEGCSGALSGRACI